MADQTQPPKNKGGRPRKHPADKSAVVSTRIHRRLREALEAEAERAGRPVAQIAEIWMEAGERLSSASQDSEVSDALVALARLAAQVGREFGSPAKERLAREALMGAWTRLLPSLFPSVEDTPEDTAYRLARVALLVEARSAWAEIARGLEGVDPEADPPAPLAVALLARPPVVRNALAANYMPGLMTGETDPLYRRLEEIAEEGRIIPSRVAALGSAIDRAVEAAPSEAGRFAALRECVTAFVEAERASVSQRLRAREAGAAIVDSADLGGSSGAL